MEPESCLHSHDEENRCESGYNREMPLSFQAFSIVNINNELPSERDFKRRKEIELKL